MMNLNQIKIDAEFQGKIPPLTFEELNQLETNILREGRIINPIILWNGTIVDGHNRFTIAKKHPEIPFSTHEKDFSNRQEAIIWICKNQLGRRNLTPEQKKYLIGKQYEAEKKSHGANDGFRGNQHDLVSAENRHLPVGVQTCARIAKENGVGKPMSKMPSCMQKVLTLRKKPFRALARKCYPVRSNRLPPKSLQLSLLHQKNVLRECLKSANPSNDQSALRLHKGILRLLIRKN